MSAESHLTDRPAGQILPEQILPDESHLTLPERYQHTRIGEVPERWTIDKPGAPIIEIGRLRSLSPDQAHPVPIFRSCGLSPEQADIFTLFMHATKDNPVSHSRITEHLLSSDRTKWDEYNLAVVSGTIWWVIDVVKTITRNPDAAVCCNTWQDGEYDHGYYLDPHLNIIDKRPQDEPISGSPAIAVAPPVKQPELEIAPVTPPTAPAKPPKSTQLTRTWSEPSAPQATRRHLALVSEPPSTASSPDQKRRLPLQIIQESLPLTEKAAVYTVHCMGKLMTDRMIEAGLHIPEQLYAACGVEGRAQLIEYVQTTVMPKVREKVSSQEPADLPAETFAELLKAVLRPN